MQHTLTTKAQIRDLFWQTFPDLPKRKIKDYSGKGLMYPTDTRCTFVDFIDQLHRDNMISDKMADTITL